MLACVRVIVSVVSVQVLACVSACCSSSSSRSPTQRVLSRSLVVCASPFQVDVQPDRFFFDMPPKPKKCKGGKTETDKKTPAKRRSEAKTTNRKSKTNKKAVVPDRDLTRALPTELMLLVFRMLPVGDLANATAVCTRWRHLALDDSLWRHRSVHYTAFCKRVPDIRTLAHVLHVAPCLRSLELYAPLKEKDMPVPNHKCKVANLVVHWRSCCQALRLVSALAGRRVESLHLVNAPITCTTLSLSLWEEVEALAHSLRSLRIQFHVGSVPVPNAERDVHFSCSPRAVDSLERLVVERGCPPTLINSLVNAHRGSLIHLELPSYATVPPLKK